MFKTLVLGFALISVNAMTAGADIPPPNDDTSKDVAEYKLVDAVGAAALYESLNVSERTTAALRTSVETVKVSRSEDGLAQAICFRTVGRLFPRGRPGAEGEPSGANSAEEHRCTLQRSNDGKKLKVFKPVIRMG